MDIHIVITRLLIASGLGIMIGYEREMRGRSAGLRTNMVVSVSACLLMIISIDLFDLFKSLNEGSVIRMDPGRIASYAVAGMGFLGAGAIIQGRGSVRGLTSAASLWAGNAVGLAVGAGFIKAAVITTALVLFALLPLRRILFMVPKERDISVFLNFKGCGDRIHEIRQVLSEFKVVILYVEFECDLENACSNYHISIRLRDELDWSELQMTLRRLEDLTHFRWTRGLVP